MVRKRLAALIALLILCFSFNAYAMTDLINGEFVPDSPEKEVRYEDRSLGNRWTWLNDEMCVQFSGGENTKKTTIQKLADNELIRRWAVPDGTGGRKIKSRDIYTGKWTQTADGIWSFLFDEYTIPVGVTKIDGVLYAFNGYGELQAEYEYYTGCKTAADGLVTADSAEFQSWLATQYVPECTSHE